jgi:hypothetical protein
LQKHSIQNVKELVANQVLTELKIREGKKWGRICTQEADGCIRRSIIRRARTSR